MQSEVCMCADTLYKSVYTVCGHAFVVGGVFLLCMGANCDNRFVYVHAWVCAHVTLVRIHMSVYVCLCMCLCVCVCACVWFN